MNDCQSIYQYKNSKVVPHPFLGMITLGFEVLFSYGLAKFEFDPAKSQLDPAKMAGYPCYNRHCPKRCCNRTPDRCQEGSRLTILLRIVKTMLRLPSKLRVGVIPGPEVYQIKMVRPTSTLAP